MNIRIAIFASGSGTNAENIILYFGSSDSVSIALILTNNPSAGVIERSKSLGVPCHVFKRNDFEDGTMILKLLENERIDVIVLAGFLLLVPPGLIEAYEGRIINIHPALLPTFGGKGYYGSKVHQAVISSGIPISGISIHHVNEHFDEGEIIFQAACYVSGDDDANSLAEKIHQLEQMYFPKVLEKYFELHRKNYRGRE